MSKLVALWRSVVAVILLAALIPVSGATADTESSSGDDLVYFNPVRGQWVLEGGDTIFYGVPGDSPLLCDWDGDGIATVGVYREKTGYMLLQNTNRTAVAESEFFYGIKGDRPVCGDWDGDGIDTPGIFRPSEAKFYLRNSNNQGFADIEFPFGFTNGIPFAGDWNGDQIDTVGLRDPDNGFISLAARNPANTPKMEGYFGAGDDYFLVGDWDGDGKDRFGLYNPADNTLSISNSLHDPNVAQVVKLDDSFGVPLTGEWDNRTGVMNRETLTTTTTTTTTTSPTTTTTTTTDATTTTTTTTAPVPATTTTTTTTTTTPTPTTVPTPTTTGDGIPFGAAGLSYTEELWGDPFTGGVLRVTNPDKVISKLTTARASGMRVFLKLVGRKVNYQNGDETFNLSMWKQELDRYAHLDLEPFFADGTIVVHYLVDEPKSRSQWGDAVVPNDVLDEMARYSKQLWPSIPTTIRVQPTKIAEYAAGYKQDWPGWEWRYLDTAWAQYSHRKGPIDEYAAAEVASAKTQRLGLIVGLNVITGGDGSSGIRSHIRSDKWIMSPEELIRYGTTLMSQPSACAFNMWTYQYDRDGEFAYFTRPDIDDAVSELRRFAAARPATTCDPY